jgi:hypothetical protein
VILGDLVVMYLQALFTDVEVAKVRLVAKLEEQHQVDITIV